MCLAFAEVPTYISIFKVLLCKLVRYKMNDKPLSIYIDESAIRKRRTLTLGEKFDIIKRHDNGETISEIGRAFGLNRSTIGTIIKNKSRILEQINLTMSMKSTATTKRTDITEDIEILLIAWLEGRNQRHIPVSLPIIQRKAETLYENLKNELGESLGKIEPFMATQEWFTKFKMKANVPHIEHIPTSEDGDSASDELIGKLPESIVRFIKEEYCDPQIFILDETGHCKGPDSTSVVGKRKLPDLSDRMGLDGAAPPPQHGTKMEGAASNYQVTCSPLISAMHEDFLLAGAAGPSHDAPSDGEHHHRHHHGGDYEHEDTIDVKAEPLFNVSPEICEDENSQNNTESSSERPSSQSSPTPGMAGPYLLKKETHCTTILDQLLRDDTFSDVTLTAEGQSIRAHKIVLCLASAYFRQVLSKESTVQNVIVFRDIKFSELKNLINFIYTGEATVDAAELESFMKTAEMLEVTSLCDGQRSIPRNFLPRYREPEMTPPDKPRTGASKRAHQSSLHSPPSKSRRVNEGASSAPPPSKHSRATTSQPSTSAAALPLSAIKSEPVSVDDTDGEDVDLFRTRVHYDDHDNNDDGGGATTTSTYDHRAKSPSQYQDMDQSPPVERRANSPDKVVPGKCPFCPPSQPQLRQGLALTKHLVTSHPEQPCAPCDACSRVFLTKAAFHAHKHDCNR